MFLAIQKRSSTKADLVSWGGGTQASIQKERHPHTHTPSLLHNTIAFF